MNQLQRIIATGVLAMPMLGTGCNSKLEPQEYKLSHIGTRDVSQLALFTDNNTLNLDQAREYVKACILKDCNNPTREDLREILRVADHVTRSGSQNNLQITSKNLLQVHREYMNKLCKNQNKGNQPL